MVKTLSLVLLICLEILLKSALDVMPLSLPCILVICDLRSFMILLQCLTLQFIIDLWVLHNISFLVLDWNCFKFSFTPLGTIFLLKHLRLECK